MALENYLDRIDAIPPEKLPEILKLVRRLEEAQKREEAQQSFLPFVKAMWPGFIEGRHHKIMADAFERVAEGKCRRLIIAMPPRHALELSTPIPTTDGWKTMADVQPGDMVFGPDGKPTRVLGKSPVYRDVPLYEVATIDGHTIRCDGDHLWTVRMPRRGGFKTYTTEQLWRREQGESLFTDRTGKAVFRKGNCTELRPVLLPVNEAVEYPKQDLLVDPYVLGLWLGDGHHAQAIITAADTDAAVYRLEFARRGYETTDHSTPMTFGVLCLKAKLRELGVLGGKHIPSQYLTASIEQRRDLVRGLMDSDGNVSAAGQCFFNQSSMRLVTQFRELLNSLGIKNTVCAMQPKFSGQDYGLSYRVSFYMAGCAMLERKASRSKDLASYNKPRSIRVERLDMTGDVQCISVDRPDGLFLVGRGYCVTHNSKSEFASFLLPAWFLGRYPHKKIIQCSNTAELAVGFGRKVRNLVGAEDYQKIFKGIGLRSDSKAAGRWSTNKNGEYFAIGVGGTVTGKGADLLILDDVHSEQEAALAAGNPAVFDSVYEWYTSGPRQRLQPGGSIVVVMTRWSKRDLTGRILQSSMERAGVDEWEVIEFPAIMPSGEPLWPEFWSLKELEAIRAELPVTKWSAQYQQNPTSEEGAILKRDWWRKWEKPDPPPVEYIMISADTALTKNTRSDYSAFTVWGVFHTPNENGMSVPNLILLNAFKDRMEFPELKAKALEVYREWKPDAFIIEAKASGLPLLYELRQMGIPVSDYTPTRASGDKIVRANSVSDILASGMVWAPERRWAEEVVEECAAFPSGDHDDFVDSVVMALMRYRQGGFVSLPTDEVDDDTTVPEKAEYY